MNAWKGTNRVTGKPQSSRADRQVRAAMSVAGSVLLLVLAFQRRIVSGLTAGAVKG